MKADQKIKLRVAVCLLLAFSVAALTVGFTRAAALGAICALLHKAHDWLRLKRYLDAESPYSKEMISFINDQLNEGELSRNTWVQVLAQPEMHKVSQNYRVELMSQAKVFEKTGIPAMEGWTEWGANRIEVNVRSYSPEQLRENVGSEAKPLRFERLMVEKSAFEILVAEKALSLLGDANPRATVVQRSLKISLRTCLKTNHIF